MLTREDRVEDAVARIDAYVRRIGVSIDSIVLEVMRAVRCFALDDGEANEILQLVRERFGDDPRFHGLADRIVRTPPI